MSESLPESAIRALREKRGELAGQVIDYQRQIERIKQELGHIDAVLRLFAPDRPPEDILPIHRRPKQTSEHLEYGEMRRRCLEAMRDHGTITAESVVDQIMRDKSLDPDGDQRLRTDLLKRALRALDALRRDGRVAKIGWGRGVKWSLKPDGFDGAKAAAQ